MKRFTDLVAIAILFVCIAWALSVNAQSMSTADEHFPMPVAEEPITTFVALSTPTFSVGNVTPVQVTGLPAGAKSIYIFPGASGNLNYGSSVVAKGDAVWPNIATSSNVKLNVSPFSPNPGIWMINNSASAATITVTIRAYK